MRRRSKQVRTAFTIAELLVVIAIIAAVTAIAIPAMRGIGQSNIMASATRQLLDDLALARHKAIVGRTTVHVVFVPRPEFMQIVNAGPRPADQALKERLKTGCFTTYALYTERAVGDQPGQRTDRYITGWRSLPEGVFISTNEFALKWGSTYDKISTLDRPFATVNLPFPSEHAPTNRVPHIAFDQNGSLLQYDNGDDGTKRVYPELYIPLAKGSIIATRDDRGSIIGFDVREIPPRNSIENYNRIRIDPLTGRATVERLEIKPRD